MKSMLGIEVIDAHAHFMTADSMRAWVQRGRSMTSFTNRTQTRTDMKNIEFPDENFNAGQRWTNELDRYGVSSVGFMIGPETYDEFKIARKLFPGYFLGYLNVQPTDPEASQKLRKQRMKASTGLSSIRRVGEVSMSTASSYIPFTRRR